MFFKNEDEFGNYPKTKAHFIEIKNTTYLPIGSKKPVVQFPDAVTERGQKHLVEMMKLMKQGHQCEIIYTVQRSDAESFSPGVEHDPEYAKLFDKAMNVGLIISPLVVFMDREQIYLTNKKLKIV